MFQGFWMRLKKSGVAFISSFLAGMVVAIVLDALGANKDFVEIAAFVTVAIVIFMMIDPFDLRKGMLAAIWQSTVAFFAAILVMAILVFLNVPRPWTDIATYVTAAVVLFIMIDPLGLRKRK